MTEKNASWGSSVVVKFHASSLNPFTGLIQSFYLDFEWLLSSFGIPWSPLTDTFSLEASIRNYGKKLKN